MGKLDNKVAIITGGGSGIGQASAILLAQEGAKVLVSGRTAETLEKTAKLIKAAGGEATFAQADVSKVEDCQRIVKKAVDSYGKLDILLNNAAILELEGVPLADYPLEKFDRVINVNLRGTFLCMKYAIPEMLRAGGGSIINVTSHVFERCLYNFGAYTASKGGVIGLARQAAADYITKNIRVNCIVPAFIRTSMFEVFLGDDPKNEEHLLAVQPIGRFGRPEEAAQVVLFLASDDSSYVTGTEIQVDGGFNRLGRA
jgi:NAD(P)-dependent dehydrogenase (short-subunit alcohol dehydrogenase family)